MPRSLSAALQTELAKTITSVGYLLTVGLSTPQHWSNIGTVTWNAINWTDTDFDLSGLDFNADADLAARLTIQNLDGAAGAIFLSATEHLYDIVVTVYQFARGALAVGDVPQIATLAVDDCEITPERVTLSLTDKNVDAQVSPRRRIAPSDGFNFATPAGTILTWGNEIITLEAADNG